MFFCVKGSFRWAALMLSGIISWGAYGFVQAQEKPAAPKETVPAGKPQIAKLTADQVAELVIYVHGSRPVLQQIRHTGIEHGRIIRTAGERSEEAAYNLRFVKGESADKDKMRLDQQMPTLEYSLIYNEGKVFGILKGAVFTPRQEASDELLGQNRHGIEALLRYKENGSTVALIGKDKQQNIDLQILDLTDKEGRRTRYYISAKSYRVLSTEYEETSANGVKVVYKCRYYDYRSAQSTLVPFRSVLFRDGVQVSERQISTITFGGKSDDTIFQNPEQTAANQ